MTREIQAAWWRLFRATFVATVIASIAIAYAISFTGNAGFMPHGHCYLWRPTILVTHVVANVGYALAYFLVPLAMVSMVRALPELFFYPRLVYLFATFILACGISHVMQVVTVWVPAYYIAAAVDVVGAVASLGTVWVLFHSRSQIEGYLARQRRVDD